MTLDSGRRCEAAAPRLCGWATFTLFFIVLAFGVLTAAPASAKSYVAERYDSQIRVLEGGDLEVTETVVFRFDGSFSHVTREIPSRRTDGIEILSASMDGRTLPFGDETGQVEVSGRSRVRVRWRFESVTDSTHQFTVVYRARGVATRNGSVDAVAWRALPGEHDYSIASSTVEFILPASLAGEPAVDTRRVDSSSVAVEPERVVISGSDIGEDGWIEATLRFPARSIVETPPAWQQRHIRATELAPRWIAAAAVAGVAGLILVLALRQRYDAPPRDKLPVPVPDAPDALPPALAGTLAANGSARLEQAMATLFSLADRGIIAIVEDPRGTLGRRRYAIERRGSPGKAAPHEEAALSIVLQPDGHNEERVTLSDARNRLSRHFGRFRAAVYRELEQAGLLDRDRQRARQRVLHASIFLFIAAGLLTILSAFGVRQFEGWPFLIPAALTVSAVFGLVVQSSMTPLSNAGVQRAERWRSYQRHLKDVAASRAHASREPGVLLPFAVGLGLAGAWAKYLKDHPVGVPGWFQALGSSGDQASFAAFIASTSTATGGGAGAGVGAAAAGGGASSAG